MVMKMIFDYSAACGCFLGGGYRNNEDNFYFNSKHLPVENRGLKKPIKHLGSTEKEALFCVFDGMGGESAGEMAACIASEIFAEQIKKFDGLAVSGKEIMCESCKAANEAICTYAMEQQLGATGTTVAAVLLIQDEIISCNIGDSKIFVVRDHLMLQISEDHTDEKIMSFVGVKKKPVLLQYLGIPNTEMAIDPYITKGNLASGDRYIICSDGVTDVIAMNDIFEIVENNDPNEAVLQIIYQVNKHNGLDNATVIVIKID